MRAPVLALAIAAVLAPTAVACGDGAELATGPIVVGPPRYHLSVEDDGRTLVLRRDAEPLLVLGADAFQAGVVDALDDSQSYDPFVMDGREGDAGVTFRSARAFHASAGDDPARATVDLDYGDGLGARLSIHDEGAAGFTLDVAPHAAGAGAPDIAVLRIRARTSGDPAEGFYGLGEWEDSVDHRGKLRAMQIEPDLELESATNEAHVPVPFLLGTHGWAMFVESKRVGAFDVARKDPAAVEATFAVAARSGAPGAPEPLRLWLFGADAPLDLVKGCYRASGQARVPPPWALGPWIWRNENRDQAEVLDDVATIRRLDLATSGLWIDRPYATAVNAFDFDPKRYGDPRAMIDRIHAAGLRFALWSTPYLEPAAASLRAEATTRGFFPPQGGIPLNGWSQPIDFTNGAAFTFWRDLVKRYTSLGVEGFKLDYGEDLAPSLGLVRNVWRFADGSDERTMHHGYSGLYHRAYAEALPEERFLLCRAAHWGEQETGCIIWPGDVDASFTQHRERFTPRGGKEITGVGGLPATVVMGLSLGVSGFPFFGADTGGYRHGPPDAELFDRWVEQTSLSSVMQVGDSSSQPPWVFTPENGRAAADVDIYRTYARLHMRLFPYEWTHAQQIKNDGRPIQRPLGLVHPELGIHPSDVYFFGDDLLVAPVVTRGERRRSFVAPAGTWIDWWDGTSYDSDGRMPIAVDAPLAKLPLLMRDGAIVPLLRPTIDTLAGAEDAAVDSFVRDPGLLWVRVAPGRPRRFVTWDGAVVERLGGGVLRVASGATFTSGFVVELMNAVPPTDVVHEAEGTGTRTPLEHAATLAALERLPQGWTWDAAGRGTLWMKLPPGSARVTVR
ncbi:MAG TPA: TIM-barrel domain-containing protein [Labilithrix sp.]|nr:TIM-barrel domain-containing protein [Labilithrix sp.]